MPMPSSVPTGAGGQEEGKAQARGPQASPDK